jgi:hypothetical protein
MSTELSEALAARKITVTLGLDADEFSARLVAALAMLAHGMGQDVAEADWWRLLDALLLIATHPANGPEPSKSSLR